MVVSRLLLVVTTSLLTRIKATLLIVIRPTVVDALHLIFSPMVSLVLLLLLRRILVVVLIVIAVLGRVTRAAEVTSIIILAGRLAGVLLLLLMVFVAFSGLGFWVIGAVTTAAGKIVRHLF